MHDIEDRPFVQEIRATIGVVKRGRRCTICKRMMQPGVSFVQQVLIVDGEFQAATFCSPLYEECPCTPSN